ncbi:MAG: hypothetical protein EA379_03200 [Phycisphaerales bacterium]|nr:MAG: hypothetical protein EA379_03200 [Phycisphaerales bacterium]
MAGPRGPAGAAGPQGPGGERGAAGETGTVARGPAGPTGPAGPEGARGAAGTAGERGRSAEGYAGAAGPAGPAGPRGAAGERGERGQTTVGPTGPAGRAGDAGVAGGSGETGSRGATTEGIAGTTGAAGPAGRRGDAGPAGQRGPAGIVRNWVSYREFWFDSNSSEIHNADRYMLQNIARYMNDNPSLELGIDGSTTSSGSGSRDQNQSSSRANTVRDALVSAGVPANRISMGSFGDANQRRDNRVELLLRTDRQTQQQYGDAGLPELQMPAGAHSPTNVSSTNWTTHQSFWFDGESANLHASDRAKVTTIADAMRRNPQLRVGIDSSTTGSPDGNTRDNPQLNERRDRAIRDALIEAGVPASRIQTGSLGEPSMRRSGRVEVLFMTDDR